MSLGLEQANVDIVDNVFMAGAAYYRDRRYVFMAEAP